VDVDLRARGVDDVEDEVALEHFLERAAERLEQLLRQLADEPDRVGEQHLALLGKAHAPARRIERGEELVLRVTPERVILLRIVLLPAFV
jgi:hypothetical protein